MKSASESAPAAATAPKEGSLVGVTRIVILALSAAGFLLDGLDAADVLFLGAMIVWLWLSDCVEIERRLMAAVSRLAFAILGRGRR